MTRLSGMTFDWGRSSVVTCWIKAEYVKCLGETVGKDKWNEWDLNLKIWSDMVDIIWYMTYMTDK